MKINIEKAVKITGTCLCCYTIKEIERRLKEYNKKNNTEYTLEIKCFLYTTNDCGICALAKNLIKSQNLKIQVIHAESEQQIEYLRKNNVHSFPALEIKAGEKTEFITGSEAGAYIASNMSKFK